MSMRDIINRLNEADNLGQNVVHFELVGWSQDAHHTESVNIDVEYSDPSNLNSIIEKLDLIIRVMGYYRLDQDSNTITFELKQVAGYSPDNTDLVVNISMLRLNELYAAATAVNSAMVNFKGVYSKNLDFE